tara:strand:- start:137 stop:769 length:633 start_codon:yes stop_codon:yes gene_type:complete
MKQSKPNYYAVIPADVRYSKKLTPNSKLLYAEITALCNMNGKCTASTQYFATLYNVSKTSIQNWLKILEDNKFINRHNKYKEGTKEILSRYINLIVTPTQKKLSTPTQNKLRDNINTKVYNNTNTTYSNKGRFKKPDLLDIKNYCLERQNNVDAEAFIDFYDSKDWKIGKNKMKDWKAAVRTWERRENKKPTMSKLDAQINAWTDAKKLL